MSTSAADIGVFVLRFGLAVVFLAHGYNHIWGGGKIAGTGRWFESLGMRPGIVHAWFASLTELGAGVMLLLGFATPLACAGVIGTMVVAWITNHRDKGFFVFNRPTEGYEYVMVLTLTAIGLAGIGGGKWSLDHALGWFDPPGWWGFGIGVVAGVGGALSLLVVFWRPKPPAAES